MKCIHIFVTSFEKICGWRHILVSHLPPLFISPYHKPCHFASVHTLTLKSRPKLLQKFLHDQKMKPSSTS